MPHAATVVRTIPCSPDRAWRAISTGELAHWLWPARFAATVVVEARPGGAFSVRSESMGMGIDGTVEAVVPGRRLVISWRWAGEDAVTRVAIDLEPEGAGTLLAVTHEGFPDAATADEHAQGWRDCLDRLPAHVAGDR